MPIQYNIKPDINLLEVIVTDAIGLEDFVSTMTDALKDPNFSRGMNTLWDITAGTLHDATGADMSLMSEFIHRHQEERGYDYKVAIVVNSELKNGLSQMYSFISGHLPNECRGFMDYDEAMAWLSE